MQEKVGNIFRCLLKISKLENFKDKGQHSSFPPHSILTGYYAYTFDKTASEPDLNYLSIFSCKNITRWKKKRNQTRKKGRKKEKGYD